MKTLLSLFLLLAVGASAAVVGTRFSEYPNVAGLTNSELFLVAVTNVMPPTNKNITYGQLRSLLASNNFVGSFTGDGRDVSNVVASYVSGVITNNINGNSSVLISANHHDIGREYIEFTESISDPLTNNTYGLRSTAVLYAGQTNDQMATASMLGELLIDSGNSNTYFKRLSGIYSYFHNNGSNFIDDARSSYSAAGNYSHGNVTNLYGYYAELENVGLGYVQNSYGIHVHPFANSGGGSGPLNTYGAHIQAADSGTNNYALYTQYGSNIFYSPTYVMDSLLSFGLIDKGTTESTGISSGSIVTSGGIGAAKNVWVGEHVSFPATASDNSIGLTFGNEIYIYRWGSGNLRFDANTANFNSDVLPVSNAAYDLGSGSYKWRQLFISGAASVYSLAASENVTASITVAGGNYANPYPSFRASSTNCVILTCPNGGSFILRVANDGTLTTVTNASGL